MPYSCPVFIKADWLLHTFGYANADGHTHPAFCLSSLPGWGSDNCRCRHRGSGVWLLRRTCRRRSHRFKAGAPIKEDCCPQTIIIWKLTEGKQGFLQPHSGCKHTFDSQRYNSFFPKTAAIDGHYSGILPDNASSQSFPSPEKSLSFILTDLLDTTGPCLE